MEKAQFGQRKNNFIGDISCDTIWRSIKISLMDLTWEQLLDLVNGAATFRGVVSSFTRRDGGQRVLCPLRGQESVIRDKRRCSGMPRFYEHIRIKSSLDGTQRRSINRTRHVTWPPTRVLHYRNSVLFSQKPRSNGSCRPSRVYTVDSAFIFGFSVSTGRCCDV